MEGISARQGGHQVAQRFTNTFFPFKLERLMMFPLASCKAKEGMLGAMLRIGVLLAGASSALLQLMAIVINRKMAAKYN
jgi:hypothetical protein